MASAETIANMLDETKWGHEFDRSEIETIALYMSVQSIKKGEYIFRQGDKQNFMAFIIDGKIEIVKESSDALEIIVVTLLPRTYFGEMSFVDDEPRSASAIAKEESTLLYLSSESFERICVEYPPIAMKILKNIAKMISQRLRMTTGKLVYTRT
jgi:CRP-like cAMP-binding protein